MHQPKKLVVMKKMKTKINSMVGSLKRTEKLQELYDDQKFENSVMLNQLAKMIGKIKFNEIMAKR